MQRAHGRAAAAAASTVAPLLQLRRAAQKAVKLARCARAVELYERALAAAELSVPRESLVIAALLNDVVMAHCAFLSQANDESTLADAVAAAPEEFKLRSLHLLHARWQAGTLFVPTAEETAYFVEAAEFPGLPAQMCGAFFYLLIATDLAEDLPACTEVQTRLQGLYGALRTALEMDASGVLERHPRTGRAWSASESVVEVARLIMLIYGLVTTVLRDEAGLLLRMRAACGLTAAEEMALRRLAEGHKAVAECSVQDLPKQAEDMIARRQQAAAADAARHGLRRCALPACAAQEPHPKLFKLCGRCRSVAYCGAAHCAEDWKRHKREDGCAAAP
jgi:hypothetical protein